MTSPFNTWTVRGERRDPDGGLSSLVGTSFGRTEERARENWRRLWGNGLDWPLELLVFTCETEEVRHE